jgi:hypothetical protein
MAIYVVTRARDDDWGDARDRSNTKPPAEARFNEIAATGHFVRLIVWEDHKSKELARANEKASENRTKKELG